MRMPLRSDWQLFQWLRPRIAPAAADGEHGEDGEDVEREHDGDEEERRKTGGAIQRALQHVFSCFKVNVF